jgi:hypothetical protein
VLAGLREAYSTRLGIGLLTRRAAGVLLLVDEGTEQGQEYIMWRLVLRMSLKNGSLEVLHCVSLAVGIGDFPHLWADRITLLRQAAVTLPVLEELATNCLVRFGEPETLFLRMCSVARCRLT